jgi:arginyl-tRNA synthetase
MKTRSGENVLLSDLLNEAVERATQIIAKRELSSEEQSTSLELLALAP